MGRRGVISDGNAPPRKRAGMKTPFHAVGRADRLLQRSNGTFLLLSRLSDRRAVYELGLARAVLSSRRLLVIIGLYIARVAA